MKNFSLLLLIDCATCEESEALSLLQTRAHAHAHGHSNETGSTNPYRRGPCTTDDWASSCWPGYKFTDFVPAGCISQGVTAATHKELDIRNGVAQTLDHGMGRGNCDQLITPARVDAFSKSLLKFGGCATGSPNSFSWFFDVPGSYAKLAAAGTMQLNFQHKFSTEATDEMRSEAFDWCMGLAEKDENCAGANVMTISHQGCRCYGGVTALMGQDTMLTCALKSGPPEDNPRSGYRINGRVAGIENIKPAKELTSCSKGWWVLAGGFSHEPRPEIDGGSLQQYPTAQSGATATSWFRSSKNPAYLQTQGLHPDTEFIGTFKHIPGGNDALSKTGSPSDCAKAVKKCMVEELEVCKDPVTGGPPKGASMIAASGDSQNYCKAWFGDVSVGKTAVAGQKAPDGALWPGESSWLCLVDVEDDDEDFGKAVVLLKGAKKSGKYTPGGPKPPKEPVPDDFTCDLCAESDNDFDPEGKKGKCQRIHDRAQKNSKRCEKRKSRPGVIRGCCPSEGCKSARETLTEAIAARDAAKKAVTDAKAANASRAELKELRATLKAAREAVKAARAEKQAACGTRKNKKEA